VAMLTSGETMTRNSDVTWKEILFLKNNSEIKLELGFPSTSITHFSLFYSLCTKLGNLGKIIVVCYCV